MWGESIVGFGSHHSKYASGRQGDWFLAGFSLRKANLTIYLMGGFGPHAKLFAALGKHKTDKGCLYVKRLPDIDLTVPRERVRRSLEGEARSDAEGTSRFLLSSSVSFPTADGRTAAVFGWRPYRTTRGR